MRKEVKDTQEAPRTRAVYRYELQATNEIFKDTSDLYNAALLSSARTQTAHCRSHSEPPGSPRASPAAVRRTGPSLEPPRGRRMVPARPTAEPGPQRGSREIFEEFGYIAGFLGRESVGGNKELDLRQGRRDSPRQSCSSSSGGRADRGQTSGKGGKSGSAKKRRGLADISKRVKAIVAELGRLTFKEVSDEVLKESQEFLPRDPKQVRGQVGSVKARTRTFEEGSTMPSTCSCQRASSARSSAALSTLQLPASLVRGSQSTGS